MTCSRLPHSDFILAGGGLAGLSLAYHLINSPLRDRSILIIDKDAKQQNDRTWCCWEEQPTLFDEIAYRVWHRLHFVGDDFTREYDLAPYRYQMIRGIDFYDFTREKLSKCSNVTFVRGNIDRVQDGTDRATVIIDGKSFSGSWVFDSMLPSSLRGSVPTSLPAFSAKQSPTVSNEIASSASGLLAMTNDQHYHHLNQHFRGWEIETDRPVFNPQLPTLFDFRTRQAGHMRFVYTLPFADNRALIEYTLFSTHLLQSEEYDAGLKTYIEEVLGIRQYTINHVEAGVIP